jgi:hypothetical protein
MAIDELAASDAAIHVAHGSQDKQAGVSRHEIAAMRGREDLIPHNAHPETPMVQW